MTRVEPWNVVFLVGFIAYVAIRGRFARATKSNVKTERRVDAAERLLLVFVGVGSLLLPVLYLFTPFLAFADYRLPAAAPWCGTVVMVAALILFYSCHADPGANWC